MGLLVLRFSALIVRLVHLLLSLVSFSAQFDGRLVTILFDFPTGLMKVLTQFLFRFVELPLGLVGVSLSATRQKHG